MQPEARTHCGACSFLLLVRGGLLKARHFPPGEAEDQKKQALSMDVTLQHMFPNQQALMTTHI